MIIKIIIIEGPKVFGIRKLRILTTNYALTSKNPYKNTYKESLLKQLNKIPSFLSDENDNDKESELLTWRLELPY